MRSIIAALLLFGLVVPTAAQTELPEHLESDFKGGYYWDTTLTVSEDPLVWAKVSQDTAGRAVRLEWFFQAANAKSGYQAQVLTTGYEPVAVAKRAGLGSTFYIVGYNERLGHTLVEQVDVATTLGATAHPQTGQLR